MLTEMTPLNHSISSSPKSKDWESVLFKQAKSWRLKSESQTLRAIIKNSSTTRGWTIQSIQMMYAKSVEALWVNFQLNLEKINPLFISQSDDFFHKSNSPFSLQRNIMKVQKFKYHYMIQTIILSQLRSWSDLKRFYGTQQHFLFFINHKIQC